MTDAKQTPLVDLLDAVPQGAVFLETESHVPFPASTSHPVGRLCHEASARIKELEAQVEALRKDAERYRWLRIQPNDTSAPRLDIVRWTASDESANEGEGLRFERADEAIDEAMKGQS